MQFQVPQFIDMSPKIIGPLTLQQFLYIVAGIIPSFALFFFIKLWLWIIIAFILISTTTTLAFLKINGRPAVKIGIAALSYFWQPRLYLWKRDSEIPGLKELKKIKVPKTSARTPLKDLFIKLTTSTHPIEKREKSIKFLGTFRIPKEKFETLRKTTGDREVARRIDYR